MTKKSIRKYLNSQRFNLNNVRSHSLYFPSSNYKYISKPWGLDTGNKIITVRLFSAQTTKTDDSSKDSSDLMVFSNADKDKLAILDYIKGKAGIYM
jgi:hypothetical protein